MAADGRLIGGYPLGLLQLLSFAAAGRLIGAWFRLRGWFGAWCADGGVVPGRADGGVVR